MKTKQIAAIVVVAGLLIVGIAAYYLSTGKKETPAETPQLPDYALKSPQIMEAYLFAKENPDALTGVNCYCGCMQKPVEDNQIHDQGIIDCFIEDNGSFESHGAGCATCVNEALRVKSLVAAGKTKDEIKTTIDAEYGHPQSGTGCAIVPNAQNSGAIFVSPNSSTGAGCAAPTTTTGM